MYPILFQLGPVTIFSLWIMIGLGLLTSLIILSRLVKKNRLRINFLADYSILIFLSGLILSRIFFVVRNYPTYFSEINLNSIIQIFDIRDKGLSVWGGITGIILSLLFFAHKNQENKLKWLDIFVVAIIGSIGFGQIGAFLDGRNYGNETTLPWGVVVESSIYAVPTHPVQIYAAIYCFILMIVLMHLFSKKINIREGNISLLGIFSYSILRFFDEFFRGDESIHILGLREAQIYALLSVLICVILWKVRKKLSSQSSSHAINH